MPKQNIEAVNISAMTAEQRDAALALDVERLLREKPQALGLAVPGMPIGSPGMDGAAYGGRRDRYDTLLVSRDGSSRVFQSHA